jgi:PIN like domain
LRRDEPQPAFLIDRCLTVDLESALRGLGYEANTLRTLFTEQTAQKMHDAVWLEYAQANGYVCLTKNQLHRESDERVLKALEHRETRCFCLMHRKLTIAGQVECFMVNAARIVQRSRKKGPYLYGVYMWPKPHVALLWPKTRRSAR